MNNKNYNYGKYSEFERTKNIYEAATPDITYPITYTEWYDLPDHLKPSALYVTFYNPIMATIIKLQNIQLSEPDMVSKIMDRFMKITNYIKNNPQVYKASVITHWVKQALFENDRDSNRKRSAYKKECVSNIEIDKDTHKEYDIFETIPSAHENDPLIGKALKDTRKILAELLASKDADLLRAIMLILNPTQRNGKKKEIPHDFRRKYPAKLAELRQILAEPASYYYDIHLDCDTFQDVINNEDLIDTATVILPDGTEAVYYGEKKKTGNNAIRYTFVSEKGTHYEYFRNAIELKVINVKPKN